MVEFVSSDARIKATLEKLGDVLVRNGAYLHPDLRVVCEGGDFSMHAAAPVKNGERAVYIPPSCLVRLHKFSFSLNAGEILISSAADVPLLEREIAGLVVELYNLSGKFKQYQKNSVYSLYDAAPNLFLAFNKGYKLRTTKYFETMAFDAAFLRSFLELRTLGKERVIVPMIEYFNHDQHAKIVKIVEPEGGMEVSIYVPPDSDQFCINYDLYYDARAFFLYEGFLDRGIEVLNSLPMELSVEGVNIIVDRNLKIPAPAELPEALKNLFGYCPYFDWETQGAVKFGFLYIPGKGAPRSLRRILHFGIRKIVQGDGKAMQIALQAEHKIISENFAFYEDLKNKLDAFTPSAQSEAFVANAKEMVESQLSIIKNYKFFDEAMKGKV